MEKSKLEKGDEEVGKWCTLPGDILAMILSRLFGKDYICFLSVCRSWRSAPPPPRSIPDPYFSEARRYPSLFHISGNSSVCKFYDPFYNGSYVAQIPDELVDSSIHFSNYGWLLMSVGQQLFFFHPFTSQRIYVPCPLQSELKWCFSSPPTSPDCMVFGIGGNDHMGRNIYLDIIHRDEIDWSGFSYRRDNVSFCSSYSHSNPVFYKGAFYCLSLDGKLGALFHPEDKGFGNRGWKIIDKLKYPCESIRESFLVESNGDLISICVGSIGEYVKIFRLKHDKKISWEEVHSLGDQMIFANRTGCISMQTQTMGNTIYFPSFDSGGNGLFYSLTSCKFHSLGLQLARKDLYNTKQMIQCAWISPSTSEIYTEDELSWLPMERVQVFPSTERVKVKTAPCAHPSFILTNLKDSKDQLFFNMFDSHHNAEQIPEIRQMQTVSYAFGWLFQVNEDFSDCLLLNPQTMEKIHLPRPPARFHQCAISSSPNDPNCVVLLVDYYRLKEYDDRINIIYCRPGDSEWTIVTIKDSEEFNFDSEGLNFDSDSEDFDLWHLLYDTISNVIGCQGKIYGLLSDFKWVEIDFDPKFKVDLLKSDIPDEVLWSMDFTTGTSEDKLYMVESCGELFVIRVGMQLYGENPSKIGKVVVFMLDRVRKMWKIVESLGENIAFFCYDRRRRVSCSSIFKGIGNTICISSSSVEKGKGNSIYFIDCFADAGNIYAFNFADGSISVSSPFPEVDTDDFAWTGLTLN